MLYPNLTHQQKKWFRRALHSELRVINVKCRLYSATGKALGAPLHLLDGEITGETSDAADGAAVTAHFTFVDPNGRLKVHLKDTKRGLWFSKQIGVHYGLWVPEMDRYVYTPVFRGPVQAISRTGNEVDVDCASREIQHQPDFVLDKDFTAKKHQRVWFVIKSLYQSRGEDRFDMAKPPRRLKESRTWRIGANVSSMGNSLIHEYAEPFQLFFRGNGALCLRRVRDKPVWVLKDGKESILTERISDTVQASGVHDTVLMRGTKKVKETIKTTTKLAAKANNNATTIEVAATRNFGVGKRVVIGRGPEKRPKPTDDEKHPGKAIQRKMCTRTIDSISGSTITLKKALPSAYEEGAKVEVFHTIKRPKAIGVRRSLKPGHSMSAKRISDGKRPSMLIVNRSKLHKRKEVKKAARKLLRDQGRVTQAVPFSCLVIPGIELGDTIRLKARGIERDVKVGSYTLALTPDGTFEFNWQGSRVPRIHRTRSQRRRRRLRRKRQARDRD